MTADQWAVQMHHVIARVCELLFAGLFFFILVMAAIAAIVITWFVGYNGDDFWGDGPNDGPGNTPGPLNFGLVLHLSF
jgi:hypothetical protein